MKATEEQLIEEIQDDFCHYLRRGLRPDNLVDDLEPNLNIDDVETLLDVHFLMTEQVQEFVKYLPRRLRRIKTSTSKQQVALQGEVRGRIRWDATYESRYQSDSYDPSLFICEQREKNHNIDENLVLKRLLYELHRIVEETDNIIEEEYGWLEEWFGKEHLQKKLNQSWLKNIHIKQIDLREDHEITGRMINTARKSRKKIYRSAAELLLRYRRVMNYELKPAEAKELLAKTFVRPDKLDLLFELYWIIKILQTFDRSAETINFKLIRSSQPLLAEWEMNGKHFEIYHDTTKPFKFKENLGTEVEDMSELSPDSFLFRSGKIFEKFEDLSQKFFDEGAGDSLWGGRPDIILTVTPKGEDKSEQVFIGEVKYTNNEDYARQGLKELLEYMAFIKEGKRYLDQRDGKDREAVLNFPRIQGFLFTDEIDFDNQKSDQVQIFTYGESDFENKVKANL